MPCYCPVAGKEENDWAIKSHPKVQKEAADCFFFFESYRLRRRPRFLGNAIYIFFCRQRICRLRHGENVRLIFINFVWVFFSFLPAKWNCGTMWTRWKETTARPWDAAVGVFAIFFFCLLSFPSSHLAVVVCWTLLPLRDRLHYVHLPLLHTCAFFFLLLLRPAALVYSVSKESKMGDRKGFSQCPFETSHRPWLFGNPRPCCCLHRNDPRVDKLSRRKEIGEGRSTSTAPKSHWFFIIIIIIFFSSTTRKGFPASFFFYFHATFERDNSTWTNFGSSSCVRCWSQFALPPRQISPGWKGGNWWELSFFFRKTKRRKKNSKRRDGNCPAAKTRFPLCWWRALRWSLTRKGTFFSSVSVLFHSVLGWKNRQHFPRDPQKRRSYL